MRASESTVCSCLSMGRHACSQNPCVRVPPPAMLHAHCVEDWISASTISPSLSANEPRTSLSRTRTRSLWWTESILRSASSTLSFLFASSRARLLPSDHQKSRRRIQPGNLGENRSIDNRQAVDAFDLKLIIDDRAHGGCASMVPNARHVRQHVLRHLHGVFGRWTPQDRKRQRPNTHRQRGGGEARRDERSRKGERKRKQGREEEGGEAINPSSRNRKNLYKPPRPRLALHRGTSRDTRGMHLQPDQSIYLSPCVSISLYLPSYACICPYLYPHRGRQAGVSSVCRGRAEKKSFDAGVAPRVSSRPVMPLQLSRRLAGASPS